MRTLPGSDKANADMNKEIVKASKMKDKELNVHDT